jgi:hypothetical protein
VSVETDRLISGKPASAQEERIEQSLRPGTLAEYVGQEKVRTQLGIFVEAARARGEALDHVLLFGPPGWARPPSRTSSPGSWASTCAIPPGRCSSARAISPPS